MSEWLVHFLVTARKLTGVTPPSNKTPGAPFCSAIPASQHRSERALITKGRCQHTARATPRPIERCDFTSLASGLTVVPAVRNGRRSRAPHRNVAEAFASSKLSLPAKLPRPASLRPSRQAQSALRAVIALQDPCENGLPAASEPERLLYKGMATLAANTRSYSFYRSI